MEKRLEIAKEYLYIPIQKGQKEQLLQIWNQDTKELELKIPVGQVENGNYSFDYQARICVKSFIGKELYLRGEFPEEVLNGIVNDDLRSEQITERPKLHLTAQYGWINDPNGMVYDGQQYHLYFQHNPFNISWENMSWGHAVSKDLMHWKQLDTTIYPDENGMMFSGCGLRNDRKMLGLPEEALLFFYTAAGDATEWSRNMPFTQRIAYSLDGGKTLTKLDSLYIGKIGKDTRDPKIFWHEESQAYIMVLFIQDNDFGIYRSTDLAEWKETQRFTLEKAWECPDLLKVPCEEGGYKWMFWSADGFYYWGEFDGYTFETDGVRHEAYISKIPYAAQTYSGVVDRIIQIPWLRFENHGENYTGAMGIPRELSCRKTDTGYILIQKMVREVEESLKAVSELSENSSYIVQLTVGQEGTQTSTVQVNGSQVVYEPQTQSLSIDGTKHEFQQKIRKLELFVDDNILEVGIWLEDRTDTQNEKVIGSTLIGMYQTKEKKNSLSYEIPESVQIQIFEMED